MAKSVMGTTFCFLLLAITLGCANSARILDGVDPQPHILPTPPLTTNTGLPSGQIPAVAPATSVDDETHDNSPLPEAPVVAPVAEDDVPADTVPAPISLAPPAGPTATSPSMSSPVGTSSATVAQNGPQSNTPELSFFMHDILGGLHPSARVVTGIIANSGDNSLPFSKPNNNVFPIQGGVPFNTGNLNNIINNNNNLPFLAGLNGPQSNTLLQNSGNNNIVNGGNNQPFVTAGQLPSGATLQQLMFGTVTVIDDELTEGQELGSAVIGRAQGFYVASSLDGTSQTIALTVLLHGGEHDHVVEDTISFFGVHRTASPDSQVAVVGGTGKYENAKGYAVVETLHHQEDQHTTDGVDTIVHFSVYLSI